MRLYGVARAGAVDMVELFAIREQAEEALRRAVREDPTLAVRVFIEEVEIEEPRELAQRSA
jgi:hypothetical protein